MTFPAIYTGMILCSVYCIANAWADRRYLPATLRMHWLLVVLNILAGAIYIAIGAKAMWDQSVWHFIILPTWIIVSMLAAAVIYRKH